jgi:chromosome segregation ATPase
LLCAAALEVLRGVEAEFAEASAVYDRYERQAAQNQTEIARKQRQIDTLNQQIEAERQQRLAEGGGRMDQSPLEMEVQRLQREITAIAADCGGKQQRWLARQNELVNLTKALTEKRDEVEEMKTRLTVYAEKKLRLTAELDAHAKDCAATQAQFNALRQELTRVNVVLNQNAGMQQRLAEFNVELEKEITGRLKDQERLAVQLQDQIDAAAGEAAQLAAEIADGAEQVLLWERKITLAQEMKAQLKPADGAASELDAMRSEIHRMEVRLAQLRRAHESAIVLMERAMENRGTMALKARAQARSGKAGDAAAAAGHVLAKQLAALEAKVAGARADAERCAADVAALERARAALLDRMAAETLQAQAAADRAEAHARELAAKQRVRRRNLDDIVFMQKQKQHLEAVLAPGSAAAGAAAAAAAAAPPPPRDPAVVAADLARQTELVRTLDGVGEYLVRQHPEAAGLLEPLREQLQAALARK